MSNQKNFLRQVGIFLAMSLSTTVLFANTIAVEQVDTGGLTLSVSANYDSAVLRVSSDNSDITTGYVKGDVIRINAGSFADGSYSYELLLQTKPSKDEPNGTKAWQNGSFLVNNGVAQANTDVAQSAKAEAERLEILSNQITASETE